MAIEKDKLAGILNGDGSVEEKTETLSKLIDEDFNSQLNAIKINREEIKEEKKQEAAKRKAAEEQLASLKEKTEKLEEALKNNDTESVKKVYDRQMQEQANVYENKLLELTNSLASYKEQITQLENTQLRFEIMKEFNKVIKDKNIASDAVDEFAEFVLGADCNKFNRKPLGDGKTMFATKDGVSIESAVKRALETTFGKRCINVSSSGGNAEGALKSTTLTSNPFKTKNITEQMRLYKENKPLYEQLKAQL